MANKLGMSTGKGYHSGIYDGYAENSNFTDTAGYLELMEKAIECEKDKSLLYAGLYCIEINGNETVMLSFKSQTEFAESSLSSKRSYVRNNTETGLLEAHRADDPTATPEITRVICIARYNF